MGENTFSFFATPGHTKGGMCIRCGKDMFTGDTLFKDSIGRTDLYGGDYNQILKSLKKLSKMEDDITVYPGHGPATKLGIEKKVNYYMQYIGKIIMLNIVLKGHNYKYEISEFLRLFTSSFDFIEDVDGGIFESQIEDSEDVKASELSCLANKLGYILSLLKI